MTVRPERSGWRDEYMSRWHRGLGPDYPMLDVDCVEWRYGRPVAVIDWKYRSNKKEVYFDDSKWAFRCYADLASRLGAEAFVLEYDRNGWFRLWHMTRGYILELRGELNEQQAIDWHKSLGNSSQNTETRHGPQSHPSDDPRPAGMEGEEETI